MLPDGYVKSNFVTRSLAEHASLRRVRYRRGFGLAHVPQEMRETCMDFLYSISQKNDKSILIRKFNIKTGEEKTKFIPYIHRWSEPYRDIVLSKLIYAADYFGVDCPSFFLSLSSPHGITRSGNFVGYDECLQNVKDSRAKLKRKLRDWGYKTSIWVNEPHENGFAHSHLLVKGEISAERIIALKLWWSKQFNYATGTFEHGLTVSLPNEENHKRTSECSTYHSGSVYNFASYMMKYIGKSLTSSFEEPKYLVFNSVLWKTKSRLFGLSRDISAYIKEKFEEHKEQKYGKKEASDWVFKSSAVCDESGNVLSEISEHRAKPTFEFKDVYLFSIPAASYSHSLLYRLRNNVLSGHRAIKRVGDLLEVYERVVNVVFGGDS